MQNAVKKQGYRFPKGKSGNPAGKKPGTSNKATIANREFWQGILDRQTPYIETALNEIRTDSKTEYFKVLKDFTEFIMPKLARTVLVGDADNPLITPTIIIQSSGIKPVTSENDANVEPAAV